MVEITVRVPEQLARRLQPVHQRLPEILELGLGQLPLSRPRGYDGAAEIIEFLVSRPSPAEIVRLRPSPLLQARVSKLLEKNRTGTLTRDEEAEMERYDCLEHLVRMAKAYAYQTLAVASQSS